jgi:hypothetical protein
MLDQLFTPVPTLVTEAQKQEFILSKYPGIPLNDLVKITGLSNRQILETYSTHILSQRQFPPNLQEKIVEVLVSNREVWYQNPGIRMRDMRVDGNSLIFDCAIQEISNSVAYHSPELRAGLIFFDGITLLAKPLGNALAGIPAGDLKSSFQELVIKFSYLYFDEQGWRFPENITYTIPVEDLRQFAESAITDQELADRSEILMGATPVDVSLSALEAIENIKQTRPTTWKVVQVEFEDWDYEENEDEEVVIIEGEVRNTGTWIAKDVEVTAEGYGNNYGFKIRSESTTLHGLLKPKETRSFTIKMSTENLRRFKLFLGWKEVE